MSKESDMISIFKFHDENIHEVVNKEFQDIGSFDGLMGYRYALSNKYSFLETAKRLHSFILW